MERILLLMVVIGINAIVYKDTLILLASGLSLVSTLVVSGKKVTYIGGQLEEGSLHWWSLGRISHLFWWSLVRMLLAMAVSGRKASYIGGQRAECALQR